MESKNRSTAQRHRSCWAGAYLPVHGSGKTPAPNQRRGLASTPFWRHGRYTVEDLGIHTEETVRLWPAAAAPSGFLLGTRWGQRHAAQSGGSTARRARMARLPLAPALRRLPEVVPTAVLTAVLTTQPPDRPWRRP